MQYSKYEQEESHLSVPLFSGIKYLRFYSLNAAVNVYNVIVLGDGPLIDI